MKLDIIIPTFRRGDALARTVWDIVKTKQDLPGVEIIVVLETDDAASLAACRARSPS